MANEKVVMFGKPNVVQSIIKEFKQNMDSADNKDSIDKLDKYDEVLDCLGKLGDMLEDIGLDEEAEKLTDIIESVTKASEDVKPKDKKEEKKEASVETNWNHHVAGISEKILKSLRK